MTLVQFTRKDGERAEAEIHRLRVMLMRYGKHLASCQVYMAGGCNCGFSGALGKP